MKKVLLIICLFFTTCIQMLAQTNFAPVGSEWYYNGNDELYNYTAGGNSSSGNWNDHVQSLKDTIIGGINCRKLLITRTKRGASGPSYFGGERTLYIYNDSDTVFFYSSETQSFNPLYIYNVQEGDTVYQMSFNTSEQQFKYIVDSIRLEQFGTLSLKAFYTHIILSNIHYGKSKNWGFLYYNTEGRLAHNGKYVERIGGAYGFFPMETKYSIDILERRCELPSGILKCYRDAEVDFNSNNLPCDDLPAVTAIKENISNSAIEIYPNPASTQFNIRSIPTFGTDCSVEISDILGREVIKAISLSHKKQYSINVEQWKNGCYFLRFKINDQFFYQKITVQH